MVMIWTRGSLLYIFLWQIFTNGKAEFVRMECPNVFKDNKENTIICVVNTQEVAGANCLADPTTINFSLFREGEVSAKVLCSTEYKELCSNSSPGPGNCSCTATDGTNKTYTFTYMGNKASHDGAQIKCEVCAATPSIEIAPNSCDKLQFGSSARLHNMESNILGIMVSVIIALLLKNWTADFQYTIRS